MYVAIAWAASAIPSIAICRIHFYFWFNFSCNPSAWRAIALTDATVAVFVVSWLWFYFLPTAISCVPFIVTASFRFISFVAAITSYNAACSHANQTAGGVPNGTKLAEQHRTKKLCQKQFQFIDDQEQRIGHRIRHTRTQLHLVVSCLICNKSLFAVCVCIISRHLLLSFGF